MENYDFENLLEKCRCCFQLSFDEKVEISEQLQMDFFNMTQLELRMESVFSNFFCKTCENQISEHVKYKMKVIERQNKMYQLFQQSTCIKVEPEDESEMEYENESFANIEEVMMKVESDESNQEIQEHFNPAQIHDDMIMSLNEFARKHNIINSPNLQNTLEIPQSIQQFNEKPYRKLKMKEPIPTNENQVQIETQQMTNIQQISLKNETEHQSDEEENSLINNFEPSKSGYRSYTLSYKRKIIEAFKNSNLTRRQFAKKYNVSRTSFSSWLQNAELIEKAEHYKFDKRNKTVVEVKRLKGAGRPPTKHLKIQTQVQASSDEVEEFEVEFENPTDVLEIQQPNSDFNEVIKFENFNNSDCDDDNDDDELMNIEKDPNIKTHKKSPSNAHSLEYKLKIVDEYLNDPEKNLSKTARDHNIPRSCLRRWVELRDEMLQTPKVAVAREGHIYAVKRLRKNKTGPKPKPKQLIAVNCIICDIECKSEFLMEKHIRNDHPEVLPTVPCEDCRMMFFTENVMRRHHLVIHEASIKCKDENCMKLFGEVKAMENHYQKFHTGERKVR